MISSLLLFSRACKSASARNSLPKTLARNGGLVRYYMPSSLSYIRLDSMRTVHIL